MSKITNEYAIAFVAKEISLEQKYQDIALALDIDQLLHGFCASSFFSSYAAFRRKHPTPSFLTEGEQHARDYVAYKGFMGAKAQGAFTWAINRVWKAKHEAGAILSADLKAAYEKASVARGQRTSLLVALIQSEKADGAGDYEAGLRVNVSALLEATGAKELAALTRQVVGAK
jgi:hypothetical protein